MILKQSTQQNNGKCKISQSFSFLQKCLPVAAQRRMAVAVTGTMMGTTGCGGLLTDTIH